MNIKIALKLLSKHEINVEVANNGLIGVEKFNQSEEGYYDTILMDIRMPVMDGLTATEKIRISNHPQGKSIPIIAMTANALQEDIEKTKNVGMNAHLCKPIDPEKLFNTLAEKISESQILK